VVALGELVRRVLPTDLLRPGTLDGLAGLVERVPVDAVGPASDPGPQA
jgi:hypothetical protein